MPLQGEKVLNDYEAKVDAEVRVAACASSAIRALLSVAISADFLEFTRELGILQQVTLPTADEEDGAKSRSSPCQLV